MASAAIIGYVTFVGDASRGILFPALWPLCQKLGGGKIEQGELRVDTKRKNKLLKMFCAK